MGQQILSSFFRLSLASMGKCDYVLMTSADSRSLGDRHKRAKIPDRCSYFLKDGLQSHVDKFKADCVNFKNYVDNLIHLPPFFITSVIKEKRNPSNEQSNARQPSALESATYYDGADSRSHSDAANLDSDAWTDYGIRPEDEQEIREAMMRVHQSTTNCTSIEVPESINSNAHGVVRDHSDHVQVVPDTSSSCEGNNPSNTASTIILKCL